MSGGFCRRCGTPSTLRVPAGDTRERPTCDACGTVAYENPKIVVSVVLYEGGRMLWIRRGTPPYDGRWTLPAGFAECGETVPEAASREVREETGLVVDPHQWQLYGVLSLPDLNEVYLSLSAPLPNHDYAPTAEASELRMFDKDEVATLELGYPDPTYALVIEAYDAIERGEVDQTRAACGRSAAATRRPGEPGSLSVQCRREPLPRFRPGATLHLMALSTADIKAILDALEASDWDSASVTVDGVTIAVSRNGAPAGSPVALAPPAPPAPSPAPSPAAPAATPTPAAAAPSEHVVSAPSVGVFWRSPRPGSPPFVEVGQTVAAGDTVCIVEMMKLMNNVVTEVGGVVTAIHVDNAAQVQYGTPLISVAPA